MNINEDNGIKRWEDYDEIELEDGTKIDMNKLMEDQARAGAALLHLAPHIGGLLTKLRPVYTFQVETEATDGYNLFVNPAFAAKLDMTEKAFVLAHEVMHCLLNHLRRERGRDHWKSNIAADYEVNDTLVMQDLFKPDTIKKMKALYDPKYNGWGFEKIYDDNPKGPENESQKGKQKAKMGKGGSGNGPTPPNGPEIELEASPEYIKGWNQAIEDYKNGKLNI